MRTAVPDGGSRLAVHVVDEGRRRVRARGLAAWLRRVAPVRTRGAVSIALVSDTRIRALNHKYRHKDYATDVLSFPAFARTPEDRASAGKPAVARPRNKRASARHASASPEPLAPGPYLGDIVIARGVARRQAAEAGHSEAVELRVLALHGLLHLLGYDHERDNDRMRRVECRLRRKGGLPEGLIERAAE
jgi:probable rRNA maturation factor